MDNFESDLANLLINMKKVCSPVCISNIASELLDRTHIINLNNNMPKFSITENCGLYYFEANFQNSIYGTLEEFGNAWKGINTKSPSFYVKQSKLHSNLFKTTNFIPFYIGKSENINTRINEHIFLEGSDTYALRLMERLNILGGIDFKYSYLELKLDPKLYFLLAEFESLIRADIIPIIGKQ